MALQSKVVMVFQLLFNSCMAVFVTCFDPRSVSVRAFESRTRVWHSIDLQSLTQCICQAAWVLLEAVAGQTRTNTFSSGRRSQH